MRPPSSRFGHPPPVGFEVTLDTLPEKLWDEIMHVAVGEWDTLNPKPLNPKPLKN